MDACEFLVSSVRIELMNAVVTNLHVSCDKLSQVNASEPK